MAGNHRMFFGAHKYELIIDLPDGYLDWLKINMIVRYQPCAEEIDEEWHRRGLYDPVIRRRKGLPPLPKPGRERGEEEIDVRDVRTMKEELIIRGFRQLAKRHHPDVGGSKRAMQLVNEAYEALRKVL